MNIFLSYKKNIIAACLKLNLKEIFPIILKLNSNDTFSPSGNQKNDICKYKEQKALIVYQ